MSWRSISVLGLVLLAVPASLRAQEAAKPAPAHTAPVLRVEAGGPTSSTSALAFSPDGKTLYAAGFDKVVRAWELQGDGSFRLAQTYRVPIGPGTRGTINVLAVSADGEWLAASGLGLFRTAAGFSQAGLVFPYRGGMTSEMLGQQALVYLFHIGRGQPADAGSKVRVLAGHHGLVLRVAFAPDRPWLLATAAQEPGQTPGSSTGRLCLWDVRQASYVDERDNLVPEKPKGLLAEAPLPAPPGFLVGLSLGRTGPGERDVQAAIAWNDGLFRIWDVAGKTVREAKDGEKGWNRAAAASPEHGWITTGADRQAGGYLQFWKDVAGRGPQAGARQLLLPPEDLRAVLPFGLALFSARPGGKVDHAAVVARGDPREGTERQVVLQLVDLAAQKPGPLIRLWPYRDSAPVIAASPQGRYLAVAGADDPAIRVFPVADLLAKQKPAVQKLAGVGDPVRSVAFLRSGQKLGLLLSEQPKTGPGAAAQIGERDLVLDFAGRSLSLDPRKQGWTLDGSAEAGWKVTKLADASDGQGLRWRLEWAGVGGDGKPVRGALTIDLAPRQRITDYTLLPPSRFIDVPLLALAVWDNDSSQPFLNVYDARKGVRVRRFTGPTRPITCLAAARDGRLLASAAEDRTVSLWSLKGLDEVLGKQGTIWGLYFREEAGRMEIDRVEEGSEAFGKLRPGDRIEGLVLKPGAEAVPPKSALEVYRTLWNVEPGKKVSLQVVRDGKKLPPVALEVGQGVDDRKPLLSLFIIQAAGGPEWIAWTPQGPYDFQGRTIDQHLGWHFNPGRLEGAAKFEPLSNPVYQKQFHRPTLLGPLVAHADLQAALDATKKPIPRPEIRLALFPDEKEAAPITADERGHLPLRQKKAHLKVTVEGPSLRDEVASLVWQMGDDGKPQALDLGKAEGQTYLVPLEFRDPGIVRLQVRLQTREADPRQAAESMLVRYQPPAPRITFADEALERDFRASPVVRREAAAAEFALKAKVTPAEGTPMTVSLEHGPRKHPSPGTEVDQKIQLEPGENVVRLWAVNRDALKGFEEQETTERTLVVLFKPEGPRLTLRAVRPLLPGAEDMPLPPGRTVVVPASRVRLVGTLTAGARIERLEVRRGTDTLAAFQPGAQEVDLDRKELELKLSPGQQDLQLWAQIAGGKLEPLQEGKRPVERKLEYRPLLPELVWIEPGQNLALTEPRDRPELDLSGWFAALPDQFHPFRMVIEITASAGAAPQRIEQEFKTRTEAGEAGKERKLAQLRLSPGPNTIVVRIDNAWKSEAPPQERVVFYRQPPTLIKVEPKLVGKLLANVEAEVRSPSRLGPLTRIVCNGEEFPLASVAKKGVDGDRWSIKIERAALARAVDRPGMYVLRFAVENAEGGAEKEIVLKPPAEAEAPRIDLLRTLDTVQEPRALVELAVRSLAPLEQVRLKQEGRDAASVPVKDQKQDTQGIHELKASLPVDLRPGENRFSIAARDRDGGTSERTFSVTYSTPPSGIVLDPVGDKVGGPDLKLKGRILLADPRLAADAKGKKLRLSIFINGFRQRTVQSDLVKEGTVEVPFEAHVILNDLANRIEIDCPDLPLSSERRAELRVQCDKPLRPSTLHVVIVGVGVERDRRAELRRLALRALQAAPVGQGLESGVFKQIVLYPDARNEEDRMLAGYVRRNDVRRTLEKVDHLVNSSKGSPSDMVLIYWLGRAVGSEGQLYLLTSESRGANPRLAETAVPLGELLADDRERRGARVMLLDVALAGESAPRPQLQLRGSQTAVIYYGWSKKDEPLPGLLEALGDLARTGKPTSLADVVQEANKARKDQAQLEHHFGPLRGEFVISLKK